MNSFKHGNNSETSIKEIDQPEKVANNDNVGTGRLYECNFCKRGFTNAQALGGHMNIHRKDKAKLAKSKQVRAEPSIPNKLSKEYLACSYFLPFMSVQKPYYPVFKPYRSYQTFVLTQNPSYFKVNSEYSSRIEKDCVDASLSLGIGIPYMEENEEKNIRKKIDENIGNGVDLELRLGQKL